MWCCPCERGWKMSIGSKQMDKLCGTFLRNHQVRLTLKERSCISPGVREFCNCLRWEGSPTYSSEKAEEDSSSRLSHLMICHNLMASQLIIPQSCIIMVIYM
ncbi:hypothetical protein SAY87_000034 [Trapa incisa]|uniref:Uncharacterized protein n=1 Tax=Trapa incisa TaxID=236973 RepID=A0AAN7GDX5_9MYRT|nr:hypothetical protein SAY87_000034 [Trapa incisa]